MALNVPVLPLVGPILGCGCDGTLNFNGTQSVTLYDGTVITPSSNIYVLTQHIFAQDIIVGAGVTVRLAGHTIACWGLYGTATSVISYDGNDASGSIAGAVTAPSTPYGANTSAGGAGRGTAGNGTAGSAANKPIGGNGGAGGDSGGNTGGNGGTGTWGVSTGPYTQPAIIATTYLGGAGGKINGGRSGGGGASSGGTSGGGGAGGGVVTIRCRRLAFEGTLRARGGHGGNAPSGDAGGGGGGGGGAIYVVYYESTGAFPTLDVSGGNGGLGSGAGVSGSAGSVGQTFTLFFG